MKEHEYWFKEVLFTREQIEKKCTELAKWVNSMYSDEDDLILVGLLKGSLPFLAQLIKDVKVQHVIDFMTVSSYGGDTQSKGNVKIVLDLKNDIKDKSILIVEDIVDSGITLKKTVSILSQRQPKSIKVLTLLDKTDGRMVNFVPDKSGFEVPNAFLVGFGLDVKEKLRNIPSVGIFDKAKLDEL